MILDVFSNNFEADPIVDWRLISRQRFRCQLQPLGGKPVRIASPVMHDLRSFIRLQEVVSPKFVLGLHPGGYLLSVGEYQRNWCLFSPLASHHLYYLTLLAREKLLGYKSSK